MKKHILLFITLCATLTAHAQYSLLERADELKSIIEESQAGSYELMIDYGCIVRIPYWRMDFSLPQHLSDEKIQELKTLYYDKMEHSEKSYHNEIHKGGGEECAVRIDSHCNIQPEEGYEMMGCPVSGKCRTLEGLQLLRFPDMEGHIIRCDMSLHRPDTIIKKGNPETIRKIDKALSRIVKQGKHKSHKVINDDPKNYEMKVFLWKPDLLKNTEGIIYEYKTVDTLLLQQFEETIYQHLYDGGWCYLEHHKPLTDSPHIEIHDSQRRREEQLDFVLGHPTEYGYIIWSISTAGGKLRVLRATGKESGIVPAW